MDRSTGSKSNRACGDAVDYICIVLSLQKLHGLPGARTRLTVHHDLLGLVWGDAFIFLHKTIERKIESPLDVTRGIFTGCTHVQQQSVVDPCRCC